MFRKVIGSTLFVFLLLSPAYSQTVSKYTEIAENSLGDRLFLVNSSFRIRKRGRINQRVFNVVTLLNQPDTIVVKTLHNYLSNCHTRTLSITEYVEYDKNNNILRSQRFQGDSPQQYATEGTVAGEIWKFSCSIDK